MNVGGRPEDRASIGVLALQGSFPLHVQALRRCGVDTREVRRVPDLEGLAGLVIPGGESTTMSLLARQYDLFDAMRELGRTSLPIFGTCAGAILMGQGDDNPPRLGIVEVEAVRNAYGRQIDSFTAELDLKPFDAPFHGIFIRAPKLRPCGGYDGKMPDSVEVLSTHEGEPVLLRCGRHLLSTFHPELTDDPRIHRLFLERCLSPCPAPR